MLYSVIVPLYNRPDEIRELLDSLTLQTFKQFEVLIVEDGSTTALNSEAIVKSYADRLDVKYFYKENGGPGIARNYGFEKAKGDYFIIFDSDVIVPPQYMQEVHTRLTTNYLDGYGGPETAHDNFSDNQKAMSYSMTSYFTTGGIRGKKKNLGTYQPRSFNMGISRKVYETVGGYSHFRSGEDIEFSIRIVKAGFKTGLISEAWVYHKRRTSFEQFYRQAKAFGQGRINVSTVHKGELKLVHFFPAAFTLYLIATALVSVIYMPLFMVMYSLLMLWMLLIFIDAAIQYRNALIGALAVFASLVQLTAYGIGFMNGFINYHILKRPNNANLRY